jgi:hypothetical protein
MTKGRDVPPVETPPLKITIDVDALTIGDQMDLEAVSSATDICRWLVAHAGVTMEQLRPLKLNELKGVIAKLTAELKAQIEPSKSSGADS